MSANAFDLHSNYIAGIRVTTKNHGLGAVKSTGNRAINATASAPRDRAEIEAQLQALNAGYWTNKRLQQTNLNDLVYALVIGYDPTMLK
jgi:hypothetical protein